MIGRGYDVVVVGGGMSGLCAALAAARHGARTALVQNRPVLGGNASSEIRMHVSGALFMRRRADARETGIVEEILEDNRARNPHHCWSIFDAVLWEKARFQEGLDLYLNTHFTDLTMAGPAIASIRATQLTTEKTFEITGRIFVDATGDGTLGFLAGAEYMSGREAKRVFGEDLAPDESDAYTMGSTLLFQAVDVGRHVPFEPPPWADTYTEDDLKLRDHREVTSGYWWIELGGKDLDTIGDAEEIHTRLMAAVYGVWDHIKNRGDHGAENLDLAWVGALPGKRESRRLLGDYVLKEGDALSGRVFDDAVAYGGWSLDLHVVGGLRATDEEPATVVSERHIPRDLFTIPYRCLYSRNVPNLMLAGRAFSVSHVAFGGARQMATLSVIGQAVGTAAAMAIEKGIPPRGVGGHIRALQQRLLKDDCYIPDCANEDEQDLARRATVTASSHIEGGGPANVINGVSRNVKGTTNAWVSAPMGGSEWIALDLPRRAPVRELIIRFDPDLSQEIRIMLSQRGLARQVPGIPPTLVKDYDLELCAGGKRVAGLEVRGNHLRHRVHRFDDAAACDRIRLVVHATRGDAHARVFEIRAYADERDT
jgi:hypothetical protein